MTRFLLENVFGSSDLGKAGTPDKQGEELVDEINYLPSVYMIRRVDGLDEIKFKLFRYAQAVDGEYKKEKSHGLIEIELIESGNDRGSKVSSQPVHKLEREVLSQLDNEIQISANLAYTKVKSHKESQRDFVLLPGGKLSARASKQSTVVSEQLSINKPASPVVFNVALSGELAEELWAGFEQEELVLELSIDWLLSGEDRGKPFQHVITQSIPINISMSSQRNCFHKYEIWADFEHDHSELQVQCFTFLKDEDSGLLKVDVAVELKDEEAVIVSKCVEFNQQDFSSSQTIYFPESTKVKNPSFAITATYSFEDGTTKKVEHSACRLRYFDASLNTAATVAS